MTKGFQFTTDMIQSAPWPMPKKVYFIAEIGINHNGSLDIARKLIDEAKECGCDAVKFQKRTIDIVYSPDVLAQPRESPWGTTQRQQKEGLEFGKKEYDAIDAYCREKAIDWFASAWDIPSQEFLRQYNSPYNKVASAMATHQPFLEVVASEKKPTFLSTGMCTLEQVDAAVAIFKKHNCPIVLMHTVSTYPSPEETLNLRCITTLRERYNVPVGYSGHEASVSPSLIAAMMGAVAIERHITLDRAMYGSDQAASLEHAGLAQLVSTVKKIPAVLGSGEKTVSDAEMAVAKKLRYW
ncbi:MAG: N-acetylneuraminate synthase family protein [Ferrovibrio sp.]|uniref:N-acetylneuraminate synthase family protein n=1 Tax=Ferrovibrio sp. TaxID=1917215 RepID=UPI00391C0E6C